MRDGVTEREGGGRERQTDRQRQKQRETETEGGSTHDVICVF